MMHFSYLLKIFFIFFFLFLFSFISVNNISAIEYADNQVLVKFNDSSNIPEPGEYGIQEITGSTNTVVISSPTKTTQELIQEFESDPNTEIVEPIFVSTIQEISTENISIQADIDTDEPDDPDDTYFDYQWAIDNDEQQFGPTPGTPMIDINAKMAWEITDTYDSTESVVIIDSGIDYNHTDLQDNIWINPGEFPSSFDTNADGILTLDELNSNDSSIDEISDIFSSSYADGVDDDGNGFIDDFIGWDFVNGDNNPIDDHGQGTSLAGIIGAIRDNNEGISGINKDVKIIAVKARDAGGSMISTNATDANNYALNLNSNIVLNTFTIKTDVINLQLTNFSNSITSLENLGILFITPAGDTIDDNIDTATEKTYPACFTHSNIFAITGTDYDDLFTMTANLGTISVDIAAPGENIITTQINNQYIMRSGTQYAAAHVAGAASLIWPTWNNLQFASGDPNHLKVKDRIMKYSKFVFDLYGYTANNPDGISGRGLSLYNLIQPIEYLEVINYYTDYYPTGYCTISPLNITTVFPDEIHNLSSTSNGALCNARGRWSHHHDTGLLYDGYYKFEISFTGGYEEVYSLIDRTPPVINTTEPYLSGNAYNVSTNSITVNGITEANTEVLIYDGYPGGTHMVTEYSDNNGNFSINVPIPDVRTYDIWVHARDDAGNVENAGNNPSATPNFQVTYQPELNIDNSVSYINTNNISNYQINGTCNGTNNVMINLSDTITDVNLSTPCTNYLWDTGVDLTSRGLNDGTITINVTQTGSTPKSKNITKDLIPPEIIITSPAYKSGVRENYTITANISESTNPLVSLDGITWYSFNNGITKFKHIPEFYSYGKYEIFNLYLEDTDAAGNTTTESIPIKKATSSKQSSTFKDKLFTASSSLLLEDIELSTFFEYITILLEKEIIDGFQDNTYRPEDYVTRGQLAKFIINAFEIPISIPSEEEQFTDVLEGYTFYYEIHTLKNKGIINGFPDGTYKPDDFVTRGQIARFLTNVIESNPDITKVTFPDVLEGYTFYEDILKIKALGFVDGFYDGSYKPDDYITRGQLAKVVVKGMQEEGLISDTDLKGIE